MSTPTLIVPLVYAKGPVIGVVPAQRALDIYTARRAVLAAGPVRHPEAIKQAGPINH